MESHLGSRAPKRKSNGATPQDDLAVKVPRLSQAAGDSAGLKSGNDADGLPVSERPAATVIHEVALPEDVVHQPKAPKSGGKPAKEYPFVLDPFQAKALECLEMGESVLVSAHTSAGKTVVAEYAIAMSLREKQRVVYTSPIKALSNQKYRELAEEFRDVGLMTGDVTIRPEASCLVMTTEILRSMLYRGSEVTREVAWIVMDEVHYLRDRERGVVWEESIVMAPKNARFVFLSATVPNAREFADWVAKVHQQPCHIVYTDYRPTPLQHYLFPAGGEGLYMVVDERSNFREDNFQTAINAVGAGVEKRKEARKKAKGPGGVPPQGPSDIFKIVKMIMNRQYDPVIVFSFSRQDCEALARQMMKLDLNDEDHRKAVEEVFWNAMDSLSEDDKKLPQVSSILPMLRRGIGIHHSGLLPILREVIEILFQEGLLKCLFATETFSIGLNMPAKTVVFTNVRKWDGDRFRWISSGEYIQMSGRAGRRGLDDRGIVILMLDEKMEPAVAKGMLQGAPDSLDSAFHLSYNLLLSQMRCQDSTPEALLQRSYKQFQADRALPDIQARIVQLEAERAAVVVEGEAEVVEYAELRDQLRKLHRDRRKLVTGPQHVLPFLQPGRLVSVLCPPADEDKSDPLADAATVWGIVTNFEKVDTAKSEGDAPRVPLPRYTVDVLTHCVADESGGLGRKKVMRPVTEGTPGAEPTVVALPLNQVDDLSSIRVYIAKDLRPLEARERAARSVDEVVRRFPDGVPTLDPEEDMQVDGGAFRKVMRKLETVEALLKGHPVARSPALRQRLQDLARKEALGAELKALKKQAKAAQSIVLKDELKARRRVLRRLGYATAEDVVELKGRVACEISSADELVLTELIFSGAFQDLSVEQATALISCFVWQEKVQGGAATTKLKEELSGPLSTLRDIAGRVGKVAEECKMEIDVDEYVSKFRPDIMELVFAWCKGAKFGEIMKMTEIFEGSLIRALRRLEELLRQLCAAAKSIGEADLAGKFQGGIEKVKRDIVFAASLYL